LSNATTVFSGGRRADENREKGKWIVINKGPHNQERGVGKNWVLSEKKGRGEKRKQIEPVGEKKANWRPKGDGKDEGEAKKKWGGGNHLGETGRLG